MEVADPMVIHYDNLRGIQLAKNLVFHARTKHIEVNYHFVHEHVLSCEVELQYFGRYLHQTSRPRQAAKILEYAWSTTPRHIELEGEGSRIRVYNGRIHTVPLDGRGLG